MSDDDPTFYQRLAEERAWRETHMPNRREDSPAIAGGGEWRSPWHLRKFGHVNVCREIASQTLQGELLARSATTTATVTRAVFMFNQRGKDDRYDENARLVAEPDRAGRWRLRIVGTDPRRVLGATHDELRLRAFPDAETVIAWATGADHWLVRLDVADPISHSEAACAGDPSGTISASR